jgi:hypothetical protein
MTTKTLLSMFLLSFTDLPIVLSMFLLSFTDLPIVLSMFLLSFTDLPNDFHYVYCILIPLNSSNERSENLVGP